MSEASNEKKLDPIEDALRNLLDSGMDRYAAATELKIMGYKIRDIARITGISSKEIGVKKSATDPGTTDQQSANAAENQVLDVIKKDVVKRSVKDIQNTYSLGELLKSMDKRSYDAGFSSPVEYVEVATNFYDQWRTTITEKQLSGELQHPLIEAIARVN
jgi:hypothetical protein